MKIGYARVSTQSQDNKLQNDELKKNGCERIFREKASGGRWDRPQLHKMLEQLREGDVVIVWKLDRLSRSLKDLLTILERIETAGAHFYSLTENIDTGSAAGRMMMQIVGSFAEFEREMFRERTLAGLASAKKQGRVGGRRPKLTTQQQKEVTRWVQSGEKSAADVARLFQVHPSTICRLMAKQGLVKVAEA